MAQVTISDASVTFPGFGRAGPVKALDAIDLELKDGDRIGLVGPNGAGKSTLLRLIGGIYPPDRGQVRRVGRTTALLSLGMGIDLDLTGRENIPLLAMHLAIQPRIIRSLSEETIAWTELGDAIDAPLRTYSSGMLLRLVFAVSTMVPPEILLMDEWLGIGDERFQLKAQERIGGFVEQTRILVIASHSAEIRERWCNRMLTLANGRIVEDVVVPGTEA